MSIDNPRGSAVKGVKGLLVWGARSISVSTLPRFLYPGYEALTASAEDVVRILAPKTGTLQNFFIKQNLPSSSTEDITYTVLVNGSPTVIEITLRANEPNGSNIISKLGVAAGFELSLQVTKSSNTIPVVREVMATIELA